MSAAFVEFWERLQSDRSFLLCDEMIVFMFGMREIKARDTKLSYQGTYGHNKPFNLKWNIIKQCQPYKNSTKKCNLCLFAQNYNNLQKGTLVHDTEGTELGGTEGAETGFSQE